MDDGCIVFRAGCFFDRGDEGYLFSPSSPTGADPGGLLAGRTQPTLSQPPRFRIGRMRFLVHRRFLGRFAAIHDERRSRDEGGFRRSNENDGRRQFFGSSHAIEWNSGNQSGFPFPVLPSKAE